MSRQTRGLIAEARVKATLFGGNEAEAQQGIGLGLAAIANALNEIAEKMADSNREQFKESEDAN